MPAELIRATVVLAGAWNRAIFTPEWVGARIFLEGGFATQILFGEESGIRFAAGGVSLMVQAGRTQIGSELPVDDALLRSIEDAATRLLDALPETPMRARGVNFAYGLDRHVDMPAAPSVNGLQVEAGRIGWKLRADSEVVNVMIDQTADACIVDVNNHFDARTARDARDSLAMRMIALQERSAAIANELEARNR